MKITNKPLFIIFKNSFKLIKNLGLLGSLIFMSINGLVDDVNSNEFHQPYLLINGEII